MNSADVAVAVQLLTAAVAMNVPTRGQCADVLSCVLCWVYSLRLSDCREADHWRPSDKASHLGLSSNLTAIAANVVLHDRQLLRYQNRHGALLEQCGNVSQLFLELSSHRTSIRDALKVIVWSSTSSGKMRRIARIL